MGLKNGVGEGILSPKAHLVVAVGVSPEIKGVPESPTAQGLIRLIIRPVGAVEVSPEVKRVPLSPTAQGHIHLWDLFC